MLQRPPRMTKVPLPGLFLDAVSQPLALPVEADGVSEDDFSFG